MIKLRADGNVLTCVRAEPVVQGQIGTVVAEVELSTAWDGYSVLVVWSAGGTERSVSLAEGRCVVPWEVLSRATVLTAAVTGTLGSSVLSTQFVTVTQILPGPSAVQMSGLAALSPHAQLVQSAIAAERSAQDAAQRAESTAAEVVAAADTLRSMVEISKSEMDEIWASVTA